MEMSAKFFASPNNLTFTSAMQKSSQRPIVKGGRNLMFSAFHGIEIHPGKSRDKAERRNGAGELNRNVERMLAE
ncbi:hypothetical protein KIN20_015680 [Parelaphostrongylus tenuis]|uniref:Uncharacterized protein n=1 Tax=Parelaphostrongylus tenuis TaxID=148309 RepID=A0AAD5N0L2_PARTN|nr:hypothetical protein KIN20_015680 [Parelaphostrongylus tenuis]